MKITAEFNSNEELLSFINAFGAIPKTTNINTYAPTITANNVEEATKELVEKVSKPKKEKAPKEEPKKDEIPKVEAEVVNVDTSSDIELKEIESNPVDTSHEENHKDPEITKEMVRATFTKLIHAGKSAEAKAITTKYGAAKLPDLKEEHYAAAYAEAEALLNG